MMQQKELSVKQNTIWNTIGSFTYLFGQWLLGLIIVRISPDLKDAGRFALAISITNIFFTLSCFNIRPYLVTDVINRFKENDYVCFRIFTCLSAFLLCIVYSNMFDYSLEQTQCIILYMVVKLGEAWVDLLHGFEQKASRMDIGGISLFARGILSVVSFVIIFKATNSLQLSIIGMAVVTIGFIFIYDMRQVKKFVNIVPRTSSAKMKELFIEFIPLTLGSFMSNFGMAYPKQILEACSGADRLGIYATVATPTVIIQVAATYIFNPLLTTFAKYNNKNEKKEFIKLFFKTCAIILGISVISMVGVKVVGRWGLKLLYGERIAAYAYLLETTVLFVSCNAFVWFFWNVLIVIRKLKHLLIINVVGLIYCVTASKYFVVKYDMIGVNYALISYTLLLISLMAVILVRSLKKE